MRLQSSQEIHETLVVLCLPEISQQARLVPLSLHVSPPFQLSPALVSGHELCGEFSGQLPADSPQPHSELPFSCNGRGQPSDQLRSGGP